MPQYDNRVIEPAIGAVSEETLNSIAEMINHKIRDIEIGVDIMNAKLFQEVVTQDKKSEVDVSSLPFKKKIEHFDKELERIDRIIKEMVNKI